MSGPENVNRAAPPDEHDAGRPAGLDSAGAAVNPETGAAGVPAPWPGPGAPPAADDARKLLRETLPPPAGPREYALLGYRFQGTDEGGVVLSFERAHPAHGRELVIPPKEWLELVAKTSWSGCSVKDVARLLQTKGAALTDKAEVEVLRERLQQALGANLQLAVRNARVLASDVLLALAGAAALVCHLAGCTTASSVVLASAVGVVVLGRPVALFIAQRLAGIRPHQPR